MPRDLAAPPLDQVRNAVAVVLALCISQVACTKPSSSPDHELHESMIIESGCISDCNDTHMLFYADNIDESDSIVGVELSVALNETVGFSYCLTYFEDRHCGESPLTWSFVKGGHMTFPCSAHSEGYLIEAPRTEYINGEAQDLPSIWLAYANGEIALTEGETPEALGSMFVCSDE